MNRNYYQNSPGQQRRQNFNTQGGIQNQNNKPFLSGGYLENNGTARTTRSQQQQRNQVNQSNLQEVQQIQTIQTVPVQAPPPVNIFPIPVDGPGSEMLKQQQLKSELQVASNEDVVMASSSAGATAATGGDANSSMMDTTEKSSRRRILGLTKKKISNKEKRIRQNRRLRKMLTPKNAIVALHELQGPANLEFQIEGQNTDFRAEININGVKYCGQGRSKVLAKNAAAEKALRDFVIAKMAAKARRVKEEKSIEAGESEAQQQESSGDLPEDPEDVPMLNLVSFALHKLFTEWEAEGFPVPDFRGNQDAASAAVQPMAVDGAAGGSASSGERKAPQPRSELPPNAASTHPTMLLSIMSPGISFVDVGSEGKPPNMTHTVSVTFHGKNYLGSGKTKKVARKNAAMAACMDVYGVIFDLEFQDQFQ